jgi:23S rRNA (adenine2503-C2)-methyltransferase
VLPDIKSFLRDELAAQFQTWNEPAYRVDQLLNWLYGRKVTSWDAMSNLPKSLREKTRPDLFPEQPPFGPAQGARDTTQKFLWQLSDGAFIESVLIPANPSLYGEASDRQTLCVSTQVGCAYGCKFCASGLDGWKRNLAWTKSSNRFWPSNARTKPRPLANNKPTSPRMLRPVRNLPVW